MKSIITTLLLTFILTTSGCIALVRDTSDPEVARAESTPLRCPPPTGEPAKYEAAIRAAMTVDYSSDRTEALDRIAAKPDLPERSQSVLVPAISTISYSSDRLRVLKTLLKNPATTEETKTTIAKHLKTLVAYSSDRKEVVEILTEASK